MDVAELDDLMPVLVADLAADAAREFLQAVAFSEGTALVPLVSPPVDASTHSLEVHTPGFEQPLILLADPVGPPTPDGYPLKLRFDPDEASAAARPSDTGSPARLEPKRRGLHTLTERHEQRLTNGGGGARKFLPPGRPLAGGKLGIESFIGSGGAGAVYRALHRDLRIPVAVKVLHEDLQRDVDYGNRFHAEALAASRLDHANLTRVIDFGQEPDGTLYLAMEFLDGVSLRAVLEKEERLALPRLLGIMAQVCAGLAHAHARGVLHRDVKPENIVLLPSIDDDGREFELVKVCDFGIAQQASDVSDLAGTPEYMSPEQCEGGELDARTDVYSCGILMYELATGKLPFMDKPPERIAYEQMYSSPDFPSRFAPDIDKRLEGIIMQALSKEREKRPADMRELRSMLRALTAPQAPVPDLVVRTPSHSFRPQKPATPVPEAGLTSHVTDPEWLERGGSWTSAHVTETPSERSPKPPVADDAVAASLLRDPTIVLGQLVKTRDPQAFQKLAMALDPAIRALAARAEGVVLWRMTSTLDVLADEGPKTPDSRAAIAATLLRLVHDPQLLGPLAEHALVSDKATVDAAWKILVRASLGGAYALYAARVKHGNPEARRRFVRLLRQIGGPSLPVIRAGLEMLVPRIQQPGAVELATDLLDAVPSALDDAAGEAVATYTRARIPVVARAATLALPRLWGQRACPVLVAMLAYQDEGVQIAAIQGLVDLHAIDEPVARHLANVVGPTGAGNAARTAAITALAQTEASGRAFAGRALGRMLPAANTGWPDDMMLTAARSLLTVLGDDARALLAERARAWSPTVQARIAAMLLGHR